MTTDTKGLSEIERVRAFRQALRMRRAALASEAATDPKTRKLLLRIDTVLALTDDLYRDMLN